MTQLGPVSPFPFVGDKNNPLVIAGVAMPGKWTLTDAKKKFGWQIQQGYGLSGAYVFPKGDELVVAKFKIEIWDSLDMIAYRLLRGTLLAKPALTIGPIVMALGIAHPELLAMGVAGVVVAEHSALIAGDGGMFTATIDFLQYRAPIPVPPKPARVTPDITPPVPVAKTLQDVEIQRLEGQAAGVSGQLAAAIK